MENPNHSYGNGWELGRHIRRTSLITSSTLDAEERLARKALGESGDHGINDGKTLTPVSSIYESGSWERRDGEEPMLDADKMRVKRGAENRQGTAGVEAGRPMPAGGDLRPAGDCASCLVRRWIR